MLHENWLFHQTFITLPPIIMEVENGSLQILVSFLIWGNFPLPWLWEKGEKHGCLGYQVCDFGYPKTPPGFRWFKIGQGTIISKDTGSPRIVHTVNPRFAQEKGLSKCTTTGGDFEDSGVLKRSSFRIGKYHHPWLQIASSNITGFFQKNLSMEMGSSLKTFVKGRHCWRVASYRFFKVAPTNHFVGAIWQFYVDELPKPTSLWKENIKKHIGENSKKFVISTLPSLKLTVRPWKWMVGIRSFTFGMGELLVSGRENSKLETSNYKGVEPNIGGKTPQIIHLFIGFGTIIFTIHLGGTIIFGSTPINPPCHIAWLLPAA